MSERAATRTEDEDEDEDEGGRVESARRFGGGVAKEVDGDATAVRTPDHAIVTSPLAACAAELTKYIPHAMDNAQNTRLQTVACRLASASSSFTKASCASVSRMGAGPDASSSAPPPSALPVRLRSAALLIVPIRCLAKQVRGRCEVLDVSWI